MKKLLTGFLSVLLFASVSFAAQGGGVALTTADNRYVNVTGDTITGNLTIEGDLKVSSSVIQGNLTTKKSSESVVDDGTITLPNATSGWGEVFVGDNEERARFSWTTAGVVTLMENTANVIATDTDTNFCIFQSGTQVVLRNRLGSTKVVKHLVNY